MKTTIFQGFGITYIKIDDKANASKGLAEAENIIDRFDLDLKLRDRVSPDVKEMIRYAAQRHAERMKV